MKTMGFYKAVRKRIIKKGDFVNPEELFLHEPKVTIEPQQSGCNEEQTFKREKLIWFFANDAKGNFSLFGSTTKAELKLYGKTGYDNGVIIQNTIIKSLYNNDIISLNSRAWTKEDVLELRKNVDVKRVLTYSAFFKKAGWLGSSFMCENYSCMRFGINYVSRKGVNYCHLFRSNEHLSCGRYGLRPVLLIPDSKVIVDLDSMKENGSWKLFIKDNKC